MAKNRYKFINKVAPAAKESLIASAVSFGLYLFDILLSFAMRGAGGALIGAVGLFAMLVAFYGFYLGIRALSEKGVNHMVTAVGTIVAGVVSILWIGMFFLGIGGA